MTRPHADVSGSGTLVPWIKCPTCGALHVRGARDSDGKPAPIRIDAAGVHSLCSACGGRLEWK